MSGAWKRKDALAYLEAIKDEKACASCYYTYSKKYLPNLDRQSLLQTSTDCACDEKEIQIKIRRAKENSENPETHWISFWFCGVFLAASVFLGGHVKCFITKKLVWTKTPENRSIFQLTEECWWASPTLGFINWDHRREPLRETRKESKPAACLFQCHVDLDQKMVLIGFTWHFLSLHPKKMMEIQVPCDTWDYSSNKFRKIPWYHWDIRAKIWHLQGVYIICFFHISVSPGWLPYPCCLASTHRSPHDRCSFSPASSWPQPHGRFRNPNIGEMKNI